MGFSPFFFASKSYNAKCRILKEKETTAMASTDITVSGLSRVGAENAEYLISKIRTIPGFPKEGILFRDFMPVLADARAFGVLLDALEAALPVNPHDFDAVAGLEARGFLFGPALAARLGQAAVEIETSAVHEGERVLIVDDLIATGGTANAASTLIEKCGGKVAGFSFVMELTGIDGMKSLQGYPASSLITMPA